MPYTSHDPALSFGIQQNLGALFRCISEDDTPVTILFGAGVSCDAGLPGWNRLIENLCEQLPDPELARLIMQDDIDPLRKVEYALRTREDPHPAPSQPIRDALYMQKSHVAVPGRLAEGIARFTRVSQGRVRLITTNFDTIVESALRTYYAQDNISSAALDDLHQWDRAKGEPDCISVLHLHGMIAPSEEAKGPIVLDAASFQSEGPRVRRVVDEALRTSHVVLVGISLTDPNVVEPLLVTRDTRSHRDGLRVFHFMIDEDHYLGSTSGDLYVNKQVEFMQDVLGVDPIVCKAFSQLQQILFDLSYCLRDPREYLRRTSRSSVRYGHRLSRSLRYAYRAIGLADREAVPQKEKSSQLSERLFEALWTPRGGPGTFLRQLGGRITTARLEQHGIDPDYLKAEGLALFLWLRHRGRRLGDVPSYRLRLMGSSAYAHREAWSQRRDIDIAPSRYTAGNVAFEGRVRLDDLSDDRDFATWQTSFGVPILWVNPRNRYDELMLGVITLNSTRRVIELEELRKAKRDGMDVKEVLSPSVLSFLTGDDGRRLRDLLSTTGCDLVTKMN